MAAIILQGFDVDSLEPIDSRSVQATLADRNALASTILYEGLPVYVTATKLLYILTDLSNANTDAGWTAVGTGTGTGGGADKLNIDLSNVVTNLSDAETKAFREHINAVKVDFENSTNLKTFWEGTLVEFNALPDSMKNDPDMYQFITDDFVPGVAVSGTTGPGGSLSIEQDGVNRGDAECLNFSGPGVTVSDADINNKINININANALNAMYTLSQSVINEAQGLTDTYTITLTETAGFSATFDDVTYNMAGFTITRVDADTLTILQDSGNIADIGAYTITPMVTVVQDSTSTEVTVVAQSLTFNVNAPSYNLVPSSWASQVIGVGNAQSFSATVENGFNIRYLSPQTANPNNFTVTVSGDQSSLSIEQDSTDLRTSAGTTSFNPEVEIALTGSTDRTTYDSRNLSLTVTEPATTITGDTTPDHVRGSANVETYSFSGVTTGYTAGWGNLPTVAGFGISESNGTISIIQDGTTTFPAVGTHTITIPYVVGLNSDPTILFNRTLVINYIVESVAFVSGAVAYTLGSAIVDPTGPLDPIVVNEFTYLTSTPSGFSITKPGADAEPYYYYFFIDPSLTIASVTVGGQPASYVDINSPNDTYKIYRSPLFYAASGTQNITLTYS